MIKNFIAFFFTCIVLSSNAQKQQALLIAIDDYGAGKCDATAVDAGGRKICNLYGCKNDANALKAVISSKFGFQSQNITTLYDQAATRKNIFNATQALLTRCAAGDIAFIFYAGHGSQVINTLSRAADEHDQLDESIVPADTKKPGIFDIRDKELAKIFNSFLDKGVNLTVIFDCCHSASMSRGEQYDTLTGRYAPTQTTDVKDPSKPPVPEDRARTRGSFLMMSAAQDDQIAQELTDGNSIHHGAFTSALITAINQLSVNTSAYDIFKAIKTILLNNGKTNQDPSLAGQVERQKQTLFNIKKGKLSDRMLIPVAAVNNGKISFLAGYAQGLQVGNELTMSGANTNASPVKVKLETIDGINYATGRMVSGSIARIKPGMLFEVTNWVSPSAPLLKLYMLPNFFSHEQVDSIKQLALQIKQSNNINWIDDPVATPPYLTLFYTNNICYASVSGGGISPIKSLDIASIAALSKGKPVYFNLPASMQAITGTREKFSRKNIVFTNNLLDAQYMLFGGLNEDNNLAYGWRAIGISAADKSSTMPAQTGTTALRNNTNASYERLVDNLSEYVMRLAKIKFWLSLPAPQTANNKFPFKMELYHQSNNLPVGDEGLKIGETFQLRLTDQSGDNDKVAEKFVYVFAIDNSGAMFLVYPSAQAGNQLNKFPKFIKYKSWNDKARETVLTKDIKQGKPAGTDHYFLIASEQQIPDYAGLFNQESVGVNSRGESGPFDAILDIENEGISGRGSQVTTPINWNLLRFSVKIHY